MKRLIAGALVLAAVTLGLGAAQAKGKGKEAVLWAAEDLKWVDVPNMKGISFVTLWGDMNKGAYGVFVKMAGGTTHPLHTHTADVKGVILSGTWTVTPEGGTEKKLGAGAYMMVPGGMKHTSACLAGSDCVLFQEGPAKFDVKPVVEKAEKKK